MFRQLFLEAKNHHSVREVPEESHFKAFEEVSVAQLSRLPEFGECPHLLSTSLEHGDVSRVSIGWVIRAVTQAAPKLADRCVSTFTLYYRFIHSGVSFLIGSTRCKTIHFLRSIFFMTYEGM